MRFIILSKTTFQIYDGEYNMKNLNCNYLVMVLNSFFSISKLLITWVKTVTVCALQDRTSGPEHGHAAARRRPSRNGPRGPSYWTGLHVWRAGRWVCDTITHTVHTSTLPVFHLLVVHFLCIQQRIRLQPIRECILVNETI